MQQNSSPLEPRSSGNNYEWREGPTTTAVKYCYAAGQRIAMRQDTAVNYLYGDHLGSTSLVTDAAGATLTETRYEPYGQPYWQWGATRTDFGFTGQRLDGFGLMDYNARYYSSTLGRFVSPDSIIPQPGSPLAWDRYGYVYSNPVNGVDPSGHFTVLIGAAIGALIGVAIVAATHPDLETRDYIQAAMVGATAGALISTGVGVGAGTAIGFTLLGAGVGTATSAAGYAVTAGDSYNSSEMAGEALIGYATGAVSALTGPAVIGANLAKSGLTQLLRAEINMLGTQASQIIHNEMFDDGTFPSGGELAGATALGAGTSYAGELADAFVDKAVTFVSGSKVAGQVAGSVTYNLVKNFGSSYYVNKGLNWIECVAEGGSCAN